MKIFKEAIINTWYSIAQDVISMEPNGVVSQYLAVEMVLDANLVEEFGDLSDKEKESWWRLDYKEKIALAREALPEKEWR